MIAGWILTSALAGTVTDATGASVSADRTTRVVVLGGGLTESVFAVGAGGQVVGVDQTSLYPPQVQELPRVSYYRHLTAEGLLALRPELVIAPETAGPPEVIAQIQRTGVPVARLTDAPTLEGAKRRLRAVGTLLDRTDEATATIADLERSLADVQRPAASPRVLFVYARGAGSLQVSGADTTAHAMIELAGGRNAVDGWTGYKPLTAEGVIAARPDVVLLTTRGLQSIGGADGLWSQPGLAATPAGQDRRVVEIDDGLLLGFGPRTGEAVQALASALANGGRGAR